MDIRSRVQRLRRGSEYSVNYFGSVEWTEVLDRDRHRNVTAILQISGAQARFSRVQPARNP